MGTTVQGRTVQGCGIEAQLNTLLLGGRASLPHTANYRPIAPPPRVAQVRKLIVQGLCCPFRHLTAISTTDLDDGVPLSEVLAPYHRMIAYLESRAADRHVALRERPVPVLMQRTQKEAGELSLAMLRLANSPESAEAAEAVIREAADLPPVVSELQRACHLEVVRASTSTRPARRLSLEHAK